MVDVTPLVPPDQKIIQSYAKGGFKISGETYATPVLVSATSVQPWAAPDPFTLQGVEFEAFSQFAHQIDVLLIGTGQTAQLLPPVIRQKFREQGLPVEVMDTGAACRTFNVLSAEGRKVVAALVQM